MTRKHLGHTARKRFGQNFLNDEYIIDQIVSAINPKSDQFLVEIGPGLGALTEPVAQRIDKLNVVELDKDLAHRLAHHPVLAKKLNIFQEDALSFDFSTLLNSQQKLRVFGNLPYNISTPLIFHLLTFHTQVEDMHFMLQKEVVNRLSAGINSKAYGRLTVMAQYYCQVMPVLEVPPSAFTPAPKVDSAVVRLTPYETLPFPAKNIKTLERVCREAFNQRRKTLRNSLNKVISIEDLERLEINPSLRAENITLEQYVLIANFIDQ